MNRLTIGSDCPVGLWIGSSGPLLSPLLLQQPRVAGFLFGGAYSLQNYFRKPSRLAEFFVHCCGRLSFSYIVAKLMHLRNSGFSSCEGMLLEPPFIRRLLGVWMLLGWLLSSWELAALDDNFLGRSTVRFVVQLMYSASTAKGSGVYRRYPENASPTDIPDTFGFNLSAGQNTPHSIRCWANDAQMSNQISIATSLGSSCLVSPAPWDWENAKHLGRMCHTLDTDGKTLARGLLKAKRYTKKHRRSRQKNMITPLPPKFLAARELVEKHKQKQKAFLTFPYHNRGRSTWQIMLCLRNLVLAKDSKSSSRNQYAKLASWQPYPELGK